MSERTAKMLVAVCGLMVVLGIAKALFPGTYVEPPRAAAPPAQEPEPTITYTAEQRKTARVLMDAVKANHKVEDSGSILRITMASFLEEKNLLWGFLNRVADADAVLNRGPRHVFIYSPDGKKIAEATPTSGLKLVK